MKCFEDICRLSQVEVKNYMQQYLKSKGYDVINEDGYLYAKGDVPVLLVAHMDTVHTEKCQTIEHEGGKISSPQGIGGDDRCGVFMIAKLVKNLHCSVLLCEDEESGGVGAKKFVNSDYIDNLEVNYMIEFDRKGNNDAVFYSCGNQEFIDFVVEGTGYKKAYGSFSDISYLMPASKLCGVNLSCGYYNPHMKSEYVIYDEMIDTIDAAEALIKQEVIKPFVYEASYHSYGWDHDWDEEYPYRYGYSNYHRNEIASKISEDTLINLEVYAINKYGVEEVLYASGETKYKCWVDLFVSNPWLSLDMVEDFIFN